MQFRTYILTAPRPESTVHDTVASMLDAGWPDHSWTFFDGTRPDGTQPHLRWAGVANLDLLDGIVKYGRDARAVMVVEDDVRWQRGAYRYLQSLPWPESAESIAVCSPYCPKAYDIALETKPTSGPWHIEDRDFYLAGAQAYIYPMATLPSFVEWLKLEQPLQYAIDRYVGTWAKEAGLHTWFHTPSLCQHTAVGNSACDTGDCGDIHRAGRLWTPEKGKGHGD
jgi:hypothetical protein